MAGSRESSLKIEYERMHQSLARVNASWPCRWPHTAGGHSHNAPATTDVTRGANCSATTVTLNPLRAKDSALVKPLTPAPMTSTSRPAPPFDSVTANIITVAEGLTTHQIRRET